MSPEISSACFGLWTHYPRSERCHNKQRYHARIRSTSSTSINVRDCAATEGATRSAVLATARGLVFAGALDRVFSAYDAATGTQLWKTRLNDVPNSSPISYMVNGRQYVALTVG